MTLLRGPLLFIALVILPQIVFGISTVVKSNTKECLYEYVEKDNKLIGNYEVTDGGFLDISVTVTDQDGKTHYEQQKEVHGQFSVNAQSDGIFTVCFDNQQASDGDKVVGFNLHSGNDLYKNIVKRDDVSQLENEMTQLKDQMDKVADKQHYMWSRERAARRTNESTNARVLWFSVFELLVLVSMSFWQIYTLRSFFEKSSFI